MRAWEFLNEDATAGATASGSVASVAFPMMKKNGQSFFGHPNEADGSDTAVIRRNDPTSGAKNKKKKGSKKAK